MYKSVLHIVFFLLFYIDNTFAQSDTSVIIDELKNLSSSANVSFDNQDFENALTYYELFLNRQTDLPLQSLMIDKMVVNYRAGICCRKLNLIGKSIDYLELADSINHLLSHYVDAIRCSIDEQLTISYYLDGALEKAARMGMQNLSHNRRFYKTNSIQYANANYYLYKIHFALGNTSLAALYLGDYIKICTETGIFKEDDLSDIKNVMELGGLYYQLNQCDDAIYCLELADTLLANINTYHPLRIRVINSLFAINRAVGNNETAEIIVEKAIDLSEGMNDENIDADDLMNLYNNVAVYLAEYDIEEALSLFEALMDEFNDSNKKNTMQYAIFLANYAEFYGIDSPEKKHLLGEAARLVTQIKDADVTIILNTCYSYICCLLSQHQVDYEEIERLADVVQNILAIKINDSFSFMTESERVLYWNQIRSWYQNILPSLAYDLKRDKLLRLCYDGLLQSRGILLLSTISIGELVHDSEDPVLLSIYNQILSSKEKDEHFDENIMESLERRILLGLPQYGNFMNTLTINVDSVRSRLIKGDVAIEFVKVEFDDNGKEDSDYDPSESTNEANQRYFALVLKREYDCPHLVELCSGNLLYKDDDRDLYYKKIWEPLATELKGVTRIFFSPEGRLFSIPIEYSILPSGECMMDRLICCRVSSTRELVRSKDNIGKDAVIYGGIRYDMTVDEMVKDSEKYRVVTASLVKERGKREALNGIKALPGTLREAQDIMSLITNTKLADMKVKLYQGIEATETSFKALSKEKKKIIHIATHGFFDSGQDDSVYISKADDDLSYTEDKTLTRSGLLFAGVDNVRFMEPIPQGVDDGVMNSREISLLDLHGTEVVVLSACQTAQGVVRGDGVFGLQRGFKKAGVNSMLMSLWKVDDDATCLLMTEFYQNWIGKEMSKHDALKDAKNEVRSHKEKGWDNPKYWAAFILLDALD